MLSKEKIVSIFKKENVSIYQTDYCYDKNLDIVLYSQDIDELLSIVKENNIKSVFYSFKMVDKSDYIISSDDKLLMDDYKYINEDVYREYERIFQVRMENWNNQFKKLSFSKPVAVHIFCFLNGCEIGIIQTNSWNDNLSDKYSELSELEGLLETLVKNQLSKENEEEESRRQEALHDIFSLWKESDEWHRYTNQTLRKKYCADLAREYSMRYNIQITSNDIYSDFEMMWLQYKDSGK